MQHYRTVCEFCQNLQQKKEQKSERKTVIVSADRYRTLMTSFGFLCEELCVQLHVSITKSALLQKRYLTFGRVNHLRIHCRGNDRQGEILQIPAQTITQNWELQLIQVCWWSIWSTKYNWVNSMTSKPIKGNKVLPFSKHCLTSSPPPAVKVRYRVGLSRPANNKTNSNYTDRVASLMTWML